MAITDDDVRKLEALAMLHLSDADRARMRAHLEHILEYMRILDGIEVTNVEPTSQVVASANVLREDVVAPSFANDDMLRNAPDARAPFYRVPRFVGE
jgi:aspartyl-tRNA(Asn)/glutamyl-tRNA(Gln) amidotransferase subunit C